VFLRLVIKAFKFDCIVVWVSRFGGIRLRCWEVWDDLGRPVVPVCIYSEPCDMQRSFSGLIRMVLEQLKKDPLGGHYFLFMNKSKNYVKILLVSKYNSRFCKKRKYLI